MKHQKFRTCFGIVVTFTTLFLLENHVFASNKISPRIAGERKSDVSVLICDVGKSGSREKKITNMACSELKRHLERFFQVSAKIVEGERPRGDNALRFIVGSGPKGAKPCDVGEFDIKMDNGTIWIWGGDVVRLARYSFGFDYRNSNKGTLDGIYRFLKFFCGVRWLMPDETWTVRVNPETSLILPDSYEKVFNWRFEKVNFDCYSCGEVVPLKVLSEIGLYYMRNGGHIIGSRSDSFVHAWGKLIGYNSHFKKHPEYYPLVNGKRKQYKGKELRGIQVCTSNPDVSAIFAEKIIKRYRKTGERIISISPNDGGGFCECAACRALDRQNLYSKNELVDLPQKRCLSDRVFQFINKVAKQVKSSEPDVRLGIILYNNYVLPPKSIERLEDNIIGHYCIDTAFFNDKVYRDVKMGDIKKWLGKGLGGIIMRLYTGSYIWGQTIHYHPHTIAEFAKACSKIKGVKGLTIEMSRDFATNGLNHYVFMEMFNNPSQDVDAVLDEYCSLAFGPGAKPMRKFFDLSEKVFMNRDSKAWVHYCEVARWYDDEYFKRAYSLISEAESKTSAVGEEAFKRRVEVIKGGLDHTRNLVEFIQCAAALRDLGYPFSLNQLDRRYKSPLLADAQKEKGVAALIKKTVKYYDRMRNFTKKHAGSVWYNGKVMLTFDRLAKWESSINLLKNLENCDDWVLFNEKYPFKLDIDNKGVGKGWAAREFDDSSWKKIAINNTWEKQGYPGYDGVAWYRMKFVPDTKDAGSKVKLTLGAVDESCWIYLNGELVGEFIYDAVKEPDGWKIPRVVDITGKVKYGELNVIAVKVEDKGGAGGIWKGAFITLENP